MALQECDNNPEIAQDLQGAGRAGGEGGQAKGREEKMGERWRRRGGRVKEGRRRVLVRYERDE